MIKNNVESNKRITLDAKHQEILDKIEEEKKELPSLKKELKDYLHEFTELKKIPKKNLSVEQFNQKYSLKNKIINLKNKIDDIQNNKSLNEYYLKVGNLLGVYYKNIDNPNIDEEDENIEDNNEENHEKIIQESKTKKNNSVMSFFENLEKNNTEKKEETIDEEKKYKNTKISDFVKQKSNFKRTSILDDYLQKIDSEYNCNITIDKNSYKCSECLNEEMILLQSEGIQICKKCGLQQSIIIESDKPSFKDPPPEICYFSYKRVNHLNE